VPHLRWERTITPDEVRWALYGPSQPRTDADRIGKAIRKPLTSIVFHYRDQPPLACNWPGAPALSSLKIF